MPKWILRENVLSFFVLPAFVILLLSLYFLSTRKSPGLITDIPEVEVQKPIISVAALGKLTPLDDVRVLAAPISGFGGTPRISNLLVAEGQQIKKGQILAIFNNRSRVLADIAVAKTKLKSLQDTIIFKSKEVSRYKESSLEGATSLVLFEVKKNELQTLTNKKKETLAEINALDIDLLDTQLISPIDGIVLSINSREGERPGPDGVVNVGANQSMGALIEVYESDISRVKVGQNVSLISENGGFKYTLLGTVTEISPQVQQRMVLSTDPTGDADARVVEVRVTLDSESSKKVQNFTGMKVIARFNHS